MNELTLINSKELMIIEWNVLTGMSVVGYDHGLIDGVVVAEPNRRIIPAQGVSDVDVDR